uniref:AAA domain-containing protein n=1 Tax=Ganoderma boninense TaxID=34458 RepID=A0A5K1JT37_9APHY|nr:AAA domain-containing protein [Ganoderma boninense]
MDAVAVLQTVLSAVQSGPNGLNISEVLAAANATADASSGGVTSFSPMQVPGLFSKLLSLSAVRDWLKLFIFGGLLEVFRRILWRSWDGVTDMFWMTVTIDENDDSGGSARTLDVSTRSFGIDAPVMSDPDELDDPTKGRHISFLPSLDTTYTLWYKHRFVSVRRNQTNDSPWQTRNKLCIRMFTRSNALLRELLLEAKKMYHKASENMISIYVSDSSDSWKLMSTQHKRPMKSIVLDPGIIELVMGDAKDFLASKEWYAERGIPHRRGYLLYGAPGSGKTSLIHSISGELNLDVYILSLTRLGMDDASLNSTISELPEECIVLIEDIDAAFHQGIKRDIADPELQALRRRDPEEAAEREARPEKAAESTCRVTLSGLLNALDGIGAQEGRIFFATTNDYAALDPALCRPGRLDLHIEFRLASKYQCRELFRRFYLPSSSEADKDEEEKENSVEKAAGEKAGDEKDSGYGSRSESDKGDGDSASPSPSPTSSTPLLTSQGEKDSDGSYVGLAHSVRAPKLSRKKAAELADRFAAAVPHRAFSMATLQGYLMTYKTRPYEAVEDLPAWIAKRLLEKKATGVRSDAPPSDSENTDELPSSSPSSPAPVSPSPSSAPLADPL